MGFLRSTWPPGVARHTVGHPWPRVGVLLVDGRGCLDGQERLGLKTLRLYITFQETGTRSCDTDLEMKLQRPASHKTLLSFSSHTRRLRVLLLRLWRQRRWRRWRRHLSWKSTKVFSTEVKKTLAKANNSIVRSVFPSVPSQAKQSFDCLDLHCSYILNYQELNKVFSVTKNANHKNVGS